MKILRTVAECRAWRSTVSGDLGFVPTMGALHTGHRSLVEKSRSENGNTIVSVFVNPTQFNDPEDLRHYPRPVDEDLAKLEAWGTDAVLLPVVEEIYNDQYNYELSEKNFSKRLCGAHRPGHFNGVLTVVLKLLNIVNPHRAYFGEKDYQQLMLIKGMVEALFLPIEIVPCPIVREADGLALSSRNLLLSPSERERAPLLYRILRESPDCAAARARLEENGFAVDYVEDIDGRRFAAATLGKVRLIDNVPL